MNLFNILQSVTIFSNNLPNVDLSGITLVVSKIINFFSFGGSIAIGILLFSLLIKIVPLPLDIYSRTATKKNALKMEKMRPELEKLQKQYANNKELYNQKMMALYKKEGYSTMASCLPSILTLVFFIVVISSFQQYSSYCKINTFNQMAYSYSESIIQNENVDIFYKGDNNEKVYIIQNNQNFETKQDLDKEGRLELINALPTEIRNIIEAETSLTGEQLDESSDHYNLIVKPAQDSAAKKYQELNNNNSFLWVKNIWIEDLPWKKAFVNKDSYLTKEKGGGIFSYTSGCTSKKIVSDINNETAYNLITGSEILDEYKNQPNGYLILVVLSIAAMFVSQLVMSKEQKTQMELQSVDGANGQAAQTSKMMTWMMPIMFGLFSFMYTASFSLYLIVSTLFSTCSTLIINKGVERKFRKQMEKEEEMKYQKRFGYLKKDKKD